ncbi:hypothetical protein [Kiloniella majae]|uniref:hypothetical protein n=1 Tax=Kiloniella majae TaxID=1938558 RepID=UPI000A2787D5|nr:hypothetical protein [Kiloniella majae]
MKNLNRQKWKKLGKLYQSQGETSWRISHSSCPQVQHLHGNNYRVWFAARDDKNRSNCTWLEFDITKPNEVVRHAPEPSVVAGGLGEFDESGAMFSWILEYHNKEYLYYTGWNIGDSVPFRNAIGLASRHGNHDNFQKKSGPVLDRSPENPLFVGNPCVVVDDFDVWHLWYLTGTAWHDNGSGLPFADYHIRHATSDDGVSWIVTEGVCIDYTHNSEMAIARPSVAYWERKFHMWYSHRGRDYPYRLGYAISNDGENWERRDDDIDLARSSEGWDSEMICYPNVFKHGDELYLIYCGNGFSQGGIGLAVLE